jgi:hypothetical protein
METLLYKKQIYPIIIPQKLYFDKRNELNSYNDMNPSMYIDGSGNIKILVRSVNYRKFYDKNFTLDENYSNSLYVLITGKFKENNLFDLDDFTIENLFYDYSIPTYPTYWKGIEDIRFINSNSILAIIPECNENGNPSVFRATIENNTVHSFINCKPNIIEKNWMPYLDENGNEMVIYSLNPFKIKQIENDVFAELSFSKEITEKLDNYHGSTNGIKYNSNEDILFLIHKNGEKICHRWLLLNCRTNTIHLSKEFYFFKHSYIEFPVSLCRFNERIFISLGINDDKAFIIETTQNAINELF